MNFSLLDHIDLTSRCVLVTIIETEGHTYKKRGAKALFPVAGELPVHGNLGSLCVDQEIALQANEAYASGEPRVITIDTSTSEDIHFGYGTHCGGKMRLLIEPVLDDHKRLYRTLRARLESEGSIHLFHNLDNGTLELRDEPHGEDGNLFVETFDAPSPLCLFGATPLARSLVDLLTEMPFRPYVCDWRRAYLTTFDGLPHVIQQEPPVAFDQRWLVLVLSHSYERDLEVLSDALASDCAYVGMLSSLKRRDSMFEALAERGVSQQALRRVHSPVGLDLGGRSDPEIAVSIAAELVRFNNHDRRHHTRRRAKSTLRLE